MLAPSVLPRGGCSSDLQAWLAAQAGPRASKALAAAAAEVTCDATACTICGRPGDPEGSQAASGSGGEEEEEGLVLRLAATWRLDFGGRTLALAGVHAACGLCRGLQDTAAVAQLLALEGAGRLDAGGQATLRSLASHFASTNGVAAPAGGPGPWLQELVSRAYALRVAASSLRGWVLQGPDGQELEPEDVPAAVRALHGGSGAAGRRGRATPGSKRKSIAGEAAPAPASSQKKKKKKSAAATPAVALPTSSKKARQQKGQPA